jgi:chromate transport protein ChrA
MLPIVWFILNMLSFSQVNSLVIVGAYAVIAIGYYAGWWYLRDQNKQFQHIGLYAGAIIALIFAVFAFFPQYDAYVGVLVAWLGILFAFLYTLDDKRSERLVAYMIFSAMGAGITLVAVDNFMGVTQPY